MGGGGSSGGSSGGNDTLWNAQANQVNQASAISGQLFDQYQQYAPTYLNNAANMVQEANNGTLATRMRGQASADANASMSAGLNAATRDMSRYGAEFNPDKTAYSLRSAGTTGALARTDAMNKATSSADALKWARNKDAFGMISGMSSDSVSALNSANSGMGNMASMQNSQNNLAAANASGWGRMGASLAYGLTRKDGGKVSLRDCRRAGVRLATGGSPTPVAGWRQRMQSMPTVSSQNNSENPAGSFISGAVPIVAGEVAKSIAKPYIEEAKNSVAKFTGEAKAAISPTSTQTAAPIVDKSTNVAGYESAANADATSAGLSSVADADAAASSLGGMANPATGAIDAGYAAAANADAAAAGLSSVAEANAAASALAAETAALEGAAAANAWNPVGWGLGALGLIGALSKKDGGDVDRGLRRDMRPGGKVSGPGTETSDSIPAWLSDKEYVLNAEAVKMVGKKKLDEINEKGLRARYGDQARMVNGEAKPNGLAFGGMLGIAAGAGTDQVMAERQQDRLDNADKRAVKQLEIAQSDLGLRKASDTRAEKDLGMRIAAEARAAAAEARAEDTRSRVKDLVGSFSKLQFSSDAERKMAERDLQTELLQFNTDPLASIVTLRGADRLDKHETTYEKDVEARGQSEAADREIRRMQAEGQLRVANANAAKDEAEAKARTEFVNSQNDLTRAINSAAGAQGETNKHATGEQGETDEAASARLQRLGDAKLTLKQSESAIAAAKQRAKDATQAWSTFSDKGIPKGLTQDQIMAIDSHGDKKLEARAVTDGVKDLKKHAGFLATKGMLKSMPGYENAHTADPDVFNNIVMAQYTLNDIFNRENSGINLPKIGVNIGGKPQITYAPRHFSYDAKDHTFKDQNGASMSAEKVQRQSPEAFNLLISQPKVAAPYKADVANPEPGTLDRVVLNLRKNAAQNNKANFGESYGTGIPEAAKVEIPLGLRAKPTGVSEVMLAAEEYKRKIRENNAGLRGGN